MIAQMLNPDWLSRPSVERVAALFGSDPYCFVGGCVRDSLMGKMPRDFDLATTLSAGEILSRVKQLSIRWIVGHPDFPITKIEVCGDEFDICSLPQAKYVESADDFKNWVRNYMGRSDFTMNSLALFPDGLLMDEFGGIHDALNKEIKFVLGFDRIAESIKISPNQIIRYLRFASTHGEGRFDPLVIQKLSACAALLQKDHPEFIRNQMMRLLEIPSPFEAIRIMHDQCIIPHALGFRLSSLAALEKLSQLEGKLGKSSSGYVRLLALLQGAPITLDAAFAHLLSRWKMEPPQLRQLKTIMDFSMFFDPDMNQEQHDQLSKKAGKATLPQIAMMRLLMEDEPFAELARYRPHL
jgi:tRNA nucleotidyltransferase/poly(A) polymerase